MIESDAVTAARHPTPATVRKRLDAKRSAVPATVSYLWVDLLDTGRDSRVQPGDVVEVEFEASTHLSVGVDAEARRFTWYVCIANTRTETDLEGYATGLSMPIQRPWMRPYSDGLYNLFISRLLTVHEEFFYGYCQSNGDQDTPRRVGRITQIRVHRRSERS